MGTLYRHEYKYLLDPCDSAILKSRVRSLLPPDPHAGEDGRYLIKSLYLDDPEDSCFFENEDGIDYRNKYRIRYYDNDPSFISLEKKTKIHGMTRKTGAVISRDLCECIMGWFLSGSAADSLNGLNGFLPGCEESGNEVLKGLLTEIRLRNLEPKVIVSYERTAFTYSAGNVRITFDENLTSSGDIEAFLKPVEFERPVYPVGTGLLEVKWDNVIPSFIRDVLDIQTLSWGAFSKYYQTRRFNCHGGLRV